MCAIGRDEVAVISQLAGDRCLVFSPQMWLAAAFYIAAAAVPGIMRGAISR